MSVLFDLAPQGSPEWLAARRGVCTGSMFGVALETLKDGRPSAKSLLYAMDLARERAGGHRLVEKYQNAEMREGQVQEPIARPTYEAHTGYLVEEVGFAYTEGREFGLSVDGLIDDDGVFECKTMVASSSLFAAVVEGDISEYRMQCVGALWLLRRQWCDLTLWAPDLAQPLHIVRIKRDEAEIERLEAGLMKFYRLVCQLEAKLRAKMIPTTTKETTTC
jgi:YqaJ-like viral recombinase domain